MRFFAGTETHAVSLADIFSDHMVIQSQAQGTIWGWGRPHEETKFPRRGIMTMRKLPQIDLLAGRLF